MTAITATRQTIIIRAMAVLLSGFIIVIGLAYLLDPVGSAATFGVPTWPHDPAFPAVKGVRDIASGLVVLAVLFTAGRRVLGWVFLAAATIPIGDMLIVLTSGGSPATAFGVHGATALVMILCGVYILSRSR